MCGGGSSDTHSLRDTHICRTFGRPGSGLNFFASSETRNSGVVDMGRHGQRHWEWGQRWWCRSNTLSSPRERGAGVLLLHHYNFQL